MHKRNLWFLILFGLLILPAWFMRTASGAPAQPLDDTTAYLPMIYAQPTPVPPTPTQPPAPTPIPSDWLGYFNAMRSIGNLPPVTNRSDWSSGCVLHSRYMVKNDVIGHSETVGNPWYTTEGDTAARNSNVMVHSSVSASDLTAMQMWMTGPFHGIGLLDPALTQTGFGSYRESIGTWRMGGCLDVLRGLGSIPQSVSFPIRWPESGQTHPFSSYTGGEYPNPLSACPGYTTPSGPPIYLQIGSGNVTPNVTAHSITRNGQPLEHCIYNETNYTNSDGSAQSLGRSVLNMRDAIVLIPRQPLVAGSTYTVSITTNGQTHTWSFQSAGSMLQLEEESIDNETWELR